MKFLIYLFCCVNFFAGCLYGQTMKIDTVYTPAGYIDGSMNSTVFIPAKPNGTVIVLVHGRGGTRNDMFPWCDTLSSLGYTCMTIDYPDLSKTTDIFPMPVRAFKTAVEFMRKSENFIGKVNSVVALGRSFGSVTVVQSLLWDNDDQYFGTDPAINDHVDAAILLYGAYEFESLRKNNSLINSLYNSYFKGNPEGEAKVDIMKHRQNITSKILLIHGIVDDLFPYQQSVAFNDSLLSISKSSKLILFSSVGHAFETNSTTQFSTTGLKAKDSVIAYLNTNFLTSVFEEDSEINSISLYPNPASREITFTGITKPENIILKIFSLSGEEVFSTNATALNNTLKLTLPASLSNGKYFVRVYDGQKNVGSAGFSIAR